MSEMRPITDDDLQAYVDAALDPARLVAVASHLESHSDIARRVEGYIRQRAELRAALAPIAAEPLPPHLDLARMICRQRRARQRWRSAAAAILLFCVGGIGGWVTHDALNRRGEAHGIASLAQEAASSYAVYAADSMRPVEIRAGNSGELVAWARQHLHYAIAVPDLSTHGYRLMGGRLVATDHGPALLLMYDNDEGTRLVMMTKNMKYDKNAPMVPQPQNEVAGFAWARNGIGFSLVGPLPSSRLHPLADDIRRQEQDALS